jgi:hypothetical protein
MASTRIYIQPGKVTCDLEIQETHCEQNGRLTHREMLNRAMGSVTSGHWSAIVFMSGLMKACLASNIRVKITVKGAQRKDESWGKLRRTRYVHNTSSRFVLVYMVFIIRKNSCQQAQEAHVNLCCLRLVYMCIRSGSSGKGSRYGWRMIDIRVFLSTDKSVHVNR